MNRKQISIFVQNRISMKAKSSIYSSPEIAEIELISLEGILSASEIFEGENPFEDIDENTGSWKDR